MLSQPRYSAGIRYDPSVLREMAARLEASADVTVVIWTVLGVVLGLAGGIGVGLAIQNTAVGAIVGAIGGGVVGYLIGEHRALEIRFTAQLALCEVAIEENTRATSMNTRALHSEIVTPPSPPVGRDGAAPAVEAVGAGQRSTAGDRGSFRWGSEDEDLDNSAFQQCQACGRRFPTTQRACPGCARGVAWSD